MPGSAFFFVRTVRNEALMETFFSGPRARARVVRIDLHGTPSECLCYAVGMSDALPGVAIRQAAKQSSRLAAASLFQHIESGRRGERCLIYPGRMCFRKNGIWRASGHGDHTSEKAF